MPIEKRKLIIIGAGGLGREVLWAAQNTDALQPAYDFLGFCDDDSAKQSGEFSGLPLLGSPERARAQHGSGNWYICAVGDNRVREGIVARVERLGWTPQTIIDPSVLVAPGVVVGEGSYVGALTILSPSAQLGRHVIINHGCSIGHDSQLSDFSQVCPGGRISGGASLGLGAFVGSNGVVGPSVKIGAWARLAASSFAMRTIADGCTAAGTPARAVFGVAPARTSSST